MNTFQIEEGPEKPSNTISSDESNKKNKYSEKKIQDKNGKVIVTSCPTTGSKETF